MRALDLFIGFVQGVSFRTGNHYALRALISQLQRELSGLSPNDGRARNGSDTHDDSAVSVRVGKTRTLTKSVVQGI